MNKWKTALLLFMGTMLQLSAQAQASADNADFMRSNGKIYVVVAVVLVVLFGLLAYVFTLDRKISKMEKHK